MEMWRSNFLSFLKAKFYLIWVVAMLMANMWIKWCSFSSISILFNLLLPLSIIELLYFLLKLGLQVAQLHPNFDEYVKTNYFGINIKNLCYALHFHILHTPCVIRTSCSVPRGKVVIWVLQMWEHWFREVRWHYQTSQWCRQNVVF